MDASDDTYLTLTPCDGEDPTPLAPSSTPIGAVDDAVTESMPSEKTDEHADDEDAEYTVKTCPNCGTSLVYSPECGGEKCPSCGYQAEVAEASTVKIVENNLYDLLHVGELNEEPERLTVTCPACGATSELDWNTVASLCPFCKSPLLANHQSARTLRPQGVVPFLISRETAQANFSAWIRRRWFAPNDLREIVRSKPLRGVYRPAWTFDFNAACRYVGERGTRHITMVTRRINGRTTVYPKTVIRWHMVSGHVRLSFDDILSYADSRIQERHHEEIAPWHLEAAVDYAADKIRGFTETSYDKKLLTALQDAKAKAVPRIQQAIMTDIGGDEQRILDMDISYSDLTYKLLLLPYWDSEYHYKNKNYKYIVNGQTGRAYGERPWSWLKIALLCGAGLLAAVGVAFFYFFKS